MCGWKNCESGLEGDMAPLLVFVAEDLGGRQWFYPSIIDVKTCAACREKRCWPADIVPDGGDRIAASAIEKGSKHVETRLEWMAITHPDYLKLKRIEPS